jgi:glycerol-1-phosphate dehydrogenase [NAD(P)+]
METMIRQTFLQIDPTGKAGEECWADYRLKLEAWHAQRPRFADFLRDWPEIKPKLAAWTRTPEDLTSILAAIDAPLNFTELTPPVSEPQARFAFMNAPLMRKRLTLGDLLLFLNWDREGLWQHVWSSTQQGHS